MQSTVKCRYAKCLHENKDIAKEDAVKDGSAYYHPDCYKTKEDIKQIIDLFQKHINPNPVYSQLQSVIKNIVFEKKLGSDFLLYGLKYYIKNKLNLNYPQGLHYVVQNKNVIREYRKEKARSINKQITIEEENISEFAHKPLKQQGFGDILKE